MRNHLFIIGLGALCVSCTTLQAPIQQAPSSASGAAMSMSSVAPFIPQTVSGALTLGPSNAPVSMLLFMNYNSPYSVDFERVLMPRLDAEFIQPGHLRITIVSVPLQKYPQSDSQAHAVICGVLAGSGADVHRLLFTGRTTYPALSSCLTNDDVLQNIMAIQHETIGTLDVTLVPTYFINGMRFTGLPEFADLRGQINEALKR